MRSAMVYHWRRLLWEAVEDIVNTVDDTYAANAEFIDQASVANADVIDQAYAANADFTDQAYVRRRRVHADNL